MWLCKLAKMTLSGGATSCIWRVPPVPVRVTAAIDAAPELGRILHDRWSGLGERLLHRTVLGPDRHLPLPLVRVALPLGVGDLDGDRRAQRAVAGATPAAVTSPSTTSRPCGASKRSAAFSPCSSASSSALT